MDGTRFDAIVRTLASRTTRRATLRALAGTALAGLLGPLGPEEAAACVRPGVRCTRRRRNRRRREHRCCGGTRCRGGRCRCPGGEKPCRRSCIPKADCCRDADCPANSGQTCQGTTCACASGRVRLSNETCAIPCPNGGNDCTAVGCPNRCSETDEGPVCAIGDASGACNQANANCPIGQACAGVFCEFVC